MKHQLTLLVTLKDRSEFTERLCRYFELVEYPFHVLFADGSLGDKNEKIFKKKHDFDYTYIRFPKDNGIEDFYKKCADAIKKVKTPYVMIADNDDFPIIGGQLKAVEFLEKNPSYVGCNGKVGGVILSPEPNSIKGKNSLFLPYYCHVMDVPVSLDQESALERIQSFLKNFYSIYYSVFRTESLKETFKYIKDLNPNDLGVHELFFSYMQISQGKIHSIPSVTYIRQKGSSQSSKTQKDWIDRLFYTDWLSDLKEATKETARHISKNEKKDCEEIYDQLYEFFVKKQKTRYIPNGFMVLNNLDALLNRPYLESVLLQKLFRYFPSTLEKLTSKGFEKKIKKDDLKKIKEVIYE